MGSDPPPSQSSTPLPPNNDNNPPANPVNAGFETSPHLKQLKGELRRSQEFTSQMSSELQAARKFLEHARETQHSVRGPYQPGPIRDQVFRSVAENSPDAIARFDRDFRYRYINPVVAQVYNLPRSSMLGKTLREVESAEETAASWEAAIEQVFATGQQGVYEFSYPGSDGERYFETLLVPEFGKDDNVTTVLAIARDVTRRKQAEEKILIQNAILNGINRILRSVLVDDSDESLGRTCLEVAEGVTQSKIGFIGEIGPDGLLHDLATSIPGWEPSTMYNKIGYPRNPGDYSTYGLFGWVLREEKSLLTNAPLDHPACIGMPAWHPSLTSFLSVPLFRDGQIAGLIAVGNRDGGYTPEDQEALETLAPAVVEAFSRKRAEAAQRLYAEQLARSNAELEQFAFIASHDLQEPLRKVRAFSEQIRSKFSDAVGEDGNDYIRRMNAAVRRMEEMIQSLLTYSRVTTKANPFTWVDLGEVTAAVLADLDVRIEQTGGQIEVGDLPVIDADALQMRQLLQNLIGNGLKFHRPDVAPLVRISAGQQVRNGQDWAELRVADNGIGFEEKYNEMIFQPFQRLHGRSEFEGSGMGLAICQKIVERHGGRIAVESVPDEGTTFIVTLPVHQES